MPRAVCLWESIQLFLPSYPYTWRCTLDLYPESPGIFCEDIMTHERSHPSPPLGNGDVHTGKHQVTLQSRRSSLWERGWWFRGKPRRWAVRSSKKRDALKRPSAASPSSGRPPAGLRRCYLLRRANGRATTNGGEAARHPPRPGHISCSPSPSAHQVFPTGHRSLRATLSAVPLPGHSLLLLLVTRPARVPLNQFLINHFGRGFTVI